MSHNDTRPLWVEFKKLDKLWYTNPGIKYGVYLRLIAERIATELDENKEHRMHTADDVIEWLIEQATKGENDIRYNYEWQLTDTH